MPDSESASSQAIQPLHSVARQTYKSAVREQLSELIQTLAIPPGERLVEAHLAARFAVSKTPVREALMALEADGLVTIVPHVGVTVTWLSLQGYEQELFILDALEQPALRRVADNIEAHELDHCARMVEEIRGVHADRDEKTYWDLTQRVHRELFAASGYPLLTELISSHLDRMRRHTAAFVYSSPESWATDFRTLAGRLERVRARKPDAAAELVRDAHAEMLAGVRERVRGGDERIIRYLDPTERP